MLNLLKNSSLMLLATSLLVLNAQEVPKKETPAMQMQKNSSKENSVFQDKNDQTIIKEEAPKKDSIAQYEANKLEATKQRLNVAQDMQKSITTQDTLDGTIASLATQIMQNKKLHTNKPVLITSFVRLDNLKKTSEFGRLVGESLINELSNRGFNVVDFRGQMGVSINPQGEYFITRDVNKLKKEVPNTYVVVGTYSRQHKKVMLNARIMDNVTGQIISSSRATYDHGLRDDCMIFKDCKPPRTIKIMKE